MDLLDDTSPILIWLRRDLRLSDHPALHAACATGRPVIPAFVLDAQYDGLAAAPKFRMGLGLEHHGASLAEAGSRLILRRNQSALSALQDLIEETGAGAVYWTRQYDPEAVSRDSEVKAALKEQGLEVKSFGGHLMFEPWTVETKTGGYYKVYTPFWRNVKNRDVEEPLQAPSEPFQAPRQLARLVTIWRIGKWVRR